jgi:hypothetical protein
LVMALAFGNPPGSGVIPQPEQPLLHPPPLQARRKKISPTAPSFCHI